MLKRFRNEIIDRLYSKQRMLNLLIGLSALVIYEVTRVTYRPYIIRGESTISILRIRLGIPWAL